MGTENHDYNTPSKGETDWHVPLNNNTEALDTDVEIRDVEANKDQYTPKAGAKFLATDTENEYLGTGEAWVKVESSGKNPSFESATVANVNNTVFASEYSGSGLGEKVQNAISSLPDGKGRVRIPARDDGRPWQWHADVTLDLLDTKGVHIDVDNNVRIEYTGTGWMLTADSPNKPHWYQQQEAVLRIDGGYWTATGTSPSGWLRVKDSFGSQIYPQQVEFRNDTNDAVGVSIENHDAFCEGSHIGGRYRTDIGIDFRPASVTGGTGTESFHSTVIDAPHVNTHNVGLRLRGNFSFSHVTQPSIVAKADDVTCLVLGTSKATGTTILSAKFENTAGISNLTAIETTDAFDWTLAPMFVNPSFNGVDTRGEFADQYDNLTVLTSKWGEVSVTDLAGTTELSVNTRSPGGEITFKNNQGAIQSADGSVKIDFGTGDVQLSGSVSSTPQDVRTIQGPGRGDTAYHDGSGSNTEGPAFYDGDAWVSQVDGSTIT